MTYFNIIKEIRWAIQERQVLNGVRNSHVSHVQAHSSNEHNKFWGQIHKSSYTPSIVLLVNLVKNVLIEHIVEHQNSVNPFNSYFINGRTVFKSCPVSGLSKSNKSRHQRLAPGTKFLDQTF